MISNSLKFWEKHYKIRYYQSITEKQTKDEIDFIKEFILSEGEDMGNLKKKP